MRALAVTLARSQARSLKVRLVGPGHPLREPLAAVPLLDVLADDPVHVVAEPAGRDLQPAQLAAEAGVQSESAAQVHLEAGHLVAVRVRHDLALEADVGGLGAGA